MSENQQTQKEKVQDLFRRFGTVTDQFQDTGAPFLIDAADSVYRALNDSPLRPPTTIDINNPNVRTVPAKSLQNTNSVTGQGVGLLDDMGEVAAVKNRIAERNLVSPPENTAGSVVNAVSDAANLGTAYGTDTANSQKDEGMLSSLVGGVSTLLGNIDMDRLLRIMTNPALQQGSVGPEANVGQNFIRRLVEANYNVSQEDALAAQTGQANNLADYKAKTAMLKAMETKSPKLTTEIIKLYKQNESYGQSLNAIADAKKYINGAYAGAPGDAKGALVGIARFFGSNIEMTDSESIEDAANRVKTAIIGSGMFGRETSSKELKLLDKLVKQISTLTSKDQVLNSFEQLTNTFQGYAQLNADLIRSAGYPSRSDISRGSGLFSKREPLSGGS